MERKKTDLARLKRKKAEGLKITMLTSYDAPTARILDEAGIDVLLVGDSAANVVLGYPDTRPVSMDEMIVLTSAVVRGNTYAYVVGDMPFMSFNVTIDEAVRNAGRFIKEAGADAVKLEGGGHVTETVRAIVRAGIPVVGHLGLTPQTADMLGGYHVQGGKAASAKKILDDAFALEEAGAMMLVMECIPDRLGDLLSEKLSIPVIGIGAGAGCDGQVLVVHDMLGIRAGFTPKFVKAWAGIGDEIKKAATGYRAEVESGEFPRAGHTFKMDDKEWDELVKLVETE